MKFNFGKKKIELTNYQKVMNVFKSDNNSDATKSCGNINKIYIEVREYYINKRRKEKFDIKIEKIRIEQNLGSFFNNFTAYNMAFYIAVFGSLFYFMIQTILSYIDTGNKIFDSVLSLMVLLGFLFFITKEIDKSIQKDKPRNFMLNISLKVLEDIENEDANKLSKSKEDADKLEKQQRLEQYINRGKVISNFVAFSEIAVGLSKVFKKNK